MKHISIKSNSIRIIYSILALVLAMNFGFVPTASAQDAEGSRIPAPATANTYIGVTLKTLGRIHMTLTVLETRDNYRPGMTKEAFIASTIANMRDRRIPEPFIEYLGAVYSYHQRKLVADDVYDADKGEALVKAFNAMLPLARRVHRKGMSGDELAELLIPRVGPPILGPNQRPIKILNSFRKFIDKLDDYLNSL